MSPLSVMTVAVVTALLAAIGVFAVLVQIVGTRQALESGKLADPATTPQTSADNAPQPFCGPTPARGRQKRIVGGSEVRRHRFPWVVMVLIRGRFRCGGSVLDSRHVLTAAHCFRIPYRHKFVVAADVEVIAGKHVYALNARRHDAIGEQRVSVNDVISHPRYNDTTDFAKHHDLAILVLGRELNWTRWVSPVCLSSSSSSLPDTATVVGWGSTTPRSRVMWSPSPPAVLKQLTVHVHGKKVCSKLGSSRIAAAMPKGQVCAISTESGVSRACNGDSGGPLFARREKNGLHVQFGVLSWGVCANRPGEPFFFTYLPHYSQWIRETVRQSPS